MPKSLDVWACIEEMKDSPSAPPEVMIYRYSTRELAQQDYAAACKRLRRMDHAYLVQILEEHNG